MRRARVKKGTRQVHTARVIKQVCHCLACQEGRRHAYPWQHQHGPERQLVVDFLNVSAKRARNKVGVHTRLDTINVISWLRDTLDLSEPVER